MSSGNEPAAGARASRRRADGAIAIVELLDDETANVMCELWVKEPPRPWRQSTGFGARYHAPMKPRLDPHVLVLGGLDFETDAGDERYILGVCGGLGQAAAAVVVVDDVEEARIEASDGGGFFCVLFGVPPVGGGSCPDGGGPARRLIRLSTARCSRASGLNASRTDRVHSCTSLAPSLQSAGETYATAGAARFEALQLQHGMRGCRHPEPQCAVVVRDHGELGGCDPVG